MYAIRSYYASATGCRPASTRPLRAGDRAADRRYHRTHGTRPHSDVKVLIADDEPMARERLRALLAEHPDLRLVAEAADGTTALDACAEHTPDIVLLDIAMPGLDGLEARNNFV